MLSPWIYVARASRPTYVLVHVHVRSSGKHAVLGQPPPPAEHQLFLQSTSPLIFSLSLQLAHSSMQRSSQVPPQLGLSGIRRPDVPVLGVKGGRGPPSGLSLTKKYPSSPKLGVLEQPASPSASNLPQIRLGLKLGCDEMDGMAEIDGAPEGSEEIDGIADIVGAAEGCDEMDGIAERVGEMDGMVLGSDDGSNDTEG